MSAVIGEPDRPPGACALSTAALKVTPGRAGGVKSAGSASLKEGSVNDNSSDDKGER